MNVYDFDGTIYDGDSTVDFYFFCLRRKPGIIKKAPQQFKGLLFYAMRKITKKEYKEFFYSFLSALDDVDVEIDSFWRHKKRKIKGWYWRQKKREDVIISASPAFLIEPIGADLGVGLVIASDVNRHTGKCEGENCRGEEKVKRFQKAFPNAYIDEFYSDAITDLPLARLAQKSFLVKGETIQEWEMEEKWRKHNGKGLQ